MITVGPHTFTTSDALGTMANLDELWGLMMQGRTSEQADKLGEGLASRLRAALAAPPDADLAGLGSAVAATLAGSPLLDELLTDVWDTLRAGSQALRDDGQLPAASSGVVTQLSSSKGGVPKLAVDSVEVDFSGVVGDLQHVRVHHGRPWQALCIYADEVIDLLQREGHPIGRGSVGENITVAGLDWSEVRPGVQLRIGAALGLVQAYAAPCASNAGFFLDRDFHRMNKSRGAVSRVYATVLEPGRISTGDEVVLEPPNSPRQANRSWLS